jgi:hypothetical protein
MFLEQARAVVVVLLFLAAIVTAMFGTEIAGAVAGAWARGSAQAAAERRRFAGARERNSGGRGLSGTWQQAKGTARAMRGAARGAHAWARQENGPVRRVLAAAATGAYLGAKGARRAAASARRKAARSAGGPHVPWRRLWRRTWAGTPGGGTGGFSRNQAWRPGPVGVCDQCGVTVARRSLEAVLGLGGRLHQLCVRCRTSRPSRADAAGTSGNGSFTGPVTGLAGERAQLTSAGQDLRLTAGRTAGDRVHPEPVTAAAGTAPAITGGTQEMAAKAIGSGRPGSTPAVPRGSTPALEGRVAARPASAVAARGQDVAVPGGDSTTHGEQDRVAQAVAAALDRVTVFQQAMEANLTSAECPVDMIEDIAAWSDRWSALSARIRGTQAADNQRLDPYVDTVHAIGGPGKSASPGYVSELR